jgi:hypothetical protein
VLIGHDWYNITAWHLSADGRCVDCGTLCCGVFEAVAGQWGRRRQPVRLRASEPEPMASSYCTEPFTLRNFAVGQSSSIGRGHRNTQAGTYICAAKGRAFMWEERDDQERPCLHCMMIELIDEFYAEYPATTGEPDAIDTDEVVTAIAKTVAELTCGQDGTIRQQLIEQLTREIMNYDAEFRRDAGTGAIGSDARH